MSNTCPQCHAPLPADAPADLCPRCLIRSAAGLGEAPSGDVDFPDIGDTADVARRLPQFEILELLGKGGMGVVYKARQTQLDRLVALKILPPVDALSPDFVERFRREARALAKLNHPNIVAVHEFGEQNGLHFFVMEYVEGANLRQLFEARKLTSAEALAIVPKICDALQYAHEEGLVHRDIKPENLLIDKKGRVKIADFGLAKLLRREPLDMTLTLSGMALGTLRYMAPEQMDKPETVDHRADLYSLGVVIYEMLTGETPVGRFELPSQKAQVDVRFDEIVLHALEREPSRRYQHASEVRDDVEKVTSSPNVAAAPSPQSPADADDVEEDGEAEHSVFAAWGGRIIALVAVILAFFNPWGAKAWYVFAAGCAVFGVLAAFGIGRRRTSPSQLPLTGAAGTTRVDWRGKLRLAGIGLLLAGIADAVGGFIWIGARMGTLTDTVRHGGAYGWPLVEVIIAITGSFAVVYYTIGSALFLMHCEDDGDITFPLLMAAIVPPGCVFGLPAAIYALVLLSKPEVKALFPVVETKPQPADPAAPSSTPHSAPPAPVNHLNNFLGFFMTPRPGYARRVGIPMLIFTGVWMIVMLVITFSVPQEKQDVHLIAMLTGLVGVPLGLLILSLRWAVLRGKAVEPADESAATTAPKPPRHLLSAALVLLCLFGISFGFSFHANHSGSAAGLTKIITVGALDPLYTRESGPSGFQTSLNFASWSFFAVVVGGIAFSALWRIGREDQGKVPRDPAWWRDWWKQVGVWGGLLLIACTVRTVMHPEKVLQPPGDRTVSSRFTKLLGLASARELSVRSDRSQVPASTSPGREDYAFTFKSAPDHAIEMWLEFWRDGRVEIETGFSDRVTAKAGVPFAGTLHLTMMDGDVASVESAGQTRFDWQLDYESKAPGWKGDASKSSAKTGTWRPNQLKSAFSRTTTWDEPRAFQPQPGETVTLLALCGFTPPKREISTLEMAWDETTLRQGWPTTAIILRARFVPVQPGELVPTHKKAAISAKEAMDLPSKNSP